VAATHKKFYYASPHRYPETMSDSSPWYVYIVQTACQRFYTGITTDVERRLQQHRDVFERKPNARGAKYFRGYEPVAVVYREACANRSAASQREHAIKRMTRPEKLALIGFAG